MKIETTLDEDGVTFVRDLNPGEVFTYQDEHYTPRMVVDTQDGITRNVILQSGVVHANRFATTRVVRQPDVKLAGIIHKY